jgi:hypothetical protein
MNNNNSLISCSLDKLVKKYKAALSIFLVQNILLLMSFEESFNISNRLPNRKRKRDHFEIVVSSLSDKEFRSSTGLSREIFNYLLFKLNELGLSSEIKKRLAINSSGSQITLACKLYIHLRLCKGADINEFLHYSIDVNHIWSQVWFPIAFNLDKILNNINFKPECKEWCDNQARLIIIMIFLFLFIYYLYYK